MSDIRGVLVTGAAGGVGRVTCQRLKDAGYRVTALARPEDSIDSIPLPRSSIEVGYVQDALAVERAMTGVDSIVHCAALLPNAIHLGHQAFQDVNVGGVDTVLRQAARRGVARVICFSTISVVDHVSRQIRREDLFDFISDSTDPYLCSKIDAEKTILKQSPDFPGHVAVIRPSFIYGPKNYAVWKEPLEMTRAGKMRLIDGGAAPIPLIYVDDIARYVLDILDRPAPADTRYDLHVLSNPQPTTIRDVFTFIADYMGVSRPRSLPSLPLRIAADLVGFLPSQMRKGRLKLLNRARVLQYSRGYDLSQVLDHAYLSTMQLTDFRIGLRAMLDDFAQAAPGTARS